MQIFKIIYIVEITILLLYKVFSNKNFVRHTRKIKAQIKMILFLSHSHLPQMSSLERHRLSFAFSFDFVGSFLGVFCCVLNISVIVYHYENWNRRNAHTHMKYVSFRLATQNQRQNWIQSANDFWAHTAHWTGFHHQHRHH